jgi:hypothetical protein
MNKFTPHHRVRLRQRKSHFSHSTEATCISRLPIGLQQQCEEATVIVIVILTVAATENEYPNPNANAILDTLKTNKHYYCFRVDEV